MIFHKSKSIKIDKYTIGMYLACAYIVTSYVAQDLLISSRLGSLCLYAFLFSSLYIIVSSFRLDIFATPFFVWYSVFLATSASLMVRSPSVSGVFGSFYVIIVSLLVAMSIQLHIKTENGFRHICWCYSLSSFLLVLLLLLTGKLAGTAGDRLGQELMGNANIFAMMMMVGVLFSLWLLFYGSFKKYHKILLITIVLFDMYALALSSGRKFFIVPLIFLYILFLYKKDKRGRRHVFTYTILFIAVVIAVWLLVMRVPVLYNAIGIRLEGLVDNFQGQGGDSSALIREQIRHLAFDKWKEAPLLGYGFDSFKYLAQEEVGHFYYSHCNYTELLYSGGIVYFLVYYFFCFRILRNSFRRKEIPISYKAFSVGIVLTLLVFDYGAVTYNSTLQMVLLMMADYATSFKASDQVFLEGERSYE